MARLMVSGYRKTAALQMMLAKMAQDRLGRVQ